MGIQRRTALGKTIDISILATQNEKTRAVGNMGVNARGDVINSNNQIIRDRTARVENQNNKSIMGSPFSPVLDNSQKTPPPEELSKSELEFEQEDILEQEEIVKTKNKSK
jgi:hypothetical protein